MDFIHIRRITDYVDATKATYDEDMGMLSISPDKWSLLFKIDNNLARPS